YQLGRFENVYVFGRRIEAGVELQLRLAPKARVKSIQATGALYMSAKQMEDAMSLHAQDELDPDTFSERRTKLQDAYARIGFRSAAIGLAVQETDVVGQYNVVVRADPGPVTTIGRIHFLGDYPVPEWRLRDLLGLSTGDVLNMQRVEEGITAID